MRRNLGAQSRQTVMRRETREALKSPARRMVRVARHRTTAKLQCTVAAAAAAAAAAGRRTLAARCEGPVVCRGLAPEPLNAKQQQAQRRRPAEPDTPPLPRAPSLPTMRNHPCRRLLAGAPLGRPKRSRNPPRPLPLLPRPRLLASRPARAPRRNTAPCSTSSRCSSTRRSKRLSARRFLLAPRGES